MNEFRHWWDLEILKEVRVERPLLASWNKNSHPDQVRLGKYLKELAGALLPLLEDQPLFLHFDVDVEDDSRLLKHNDLENFLTPLFCKSKCLDPSRFVLVSARKYVKGGGSRITIGTAAEVPEEERPIPPMFHLCAGSGASGPAWKKNIAVRLAQQVSTPLADGPVCVLVAVRCASHRNWSMLWKPIGDAMGAVLGVPDTHKPFHLNDDRVVDLQFHLTIDELLGHNVDVGLWWASHEGPMPPMYPAEGFEHLLMTPELEREIERRLAEHAAHPERAIPWETVRDDVLARLAEKSST